MRHGHENLEQVINRLSELDHLLAPKSLENDHPCYTLNFGDKINLHLREFVLKEGNRDGWFLSSKFEVVRYRSSKAYNNNIKIIGNVLAEKMEYFDRPISSAILYICKGNVNNVSDSLVEFEPNDIIAKYSSVILNGQGDALFVPVVHTLFEPRNAHHQPE